MFNANPQQKLNLNIIEMGTVLMSTLTLEKSMIVEICGCNIILSIETPKIHNEHISC